MCVTVDSPPALRGLSDNDPGARTQGGIVRGNSHKFGQLSYHTKLFFTIQYTDGGEHLNTHIVALAGSVRNRVRRQLMDKSCCVVPEEIEGRDLLQSHNGIGQILSQFVFVGKSSRSSINVNHRHGAVTWKSLCDCKRLILSVSPVFTEYLTSIFHLFLRRIRRQARHREPPPTSYRAACALDQDCRLLMDGRRGRSLFDELGCFLRMRHVGHMAGIYFDRLALGALRHHALLVRLDRPVCGSHHVPGRLGLPGGTPDLVGKRVRWDRHLRYSHVVGLGGGTIRSEVDREMRLVYPAGPVAVRLECFGRLRQGLFDRRTAVTFIECKCGDVDQPGDPVISSRSRDDASTVRVPDKNSRAADPPQRTSYCGDVARERVEAILGGDHLVPFRLKRWNPLV